MARETYMYARKMDKLIERILCDAYSQPLANLLVLLSDYARCLYEEAMNREDVRNAEIAYDVFSNIERVLADILREDDFVDVVKQFVNNISNYIQDNWNENAAA